MLATVVGAAGPWVKVQDALRLRHEEVAVSIDKEIERRKKLGVPLSDASIDWFDDVTSALKIDGKRGDRAAVAGALEKAQAVMAGVLEPLAPYTADPQLAGVEVRLRALGKARVLQLQSDLGASVSLIEQHGIQRVFLAECLAGARFESDTGSIDVDDLAPGEKETRDIVDVLDVSGLVLAVFTVARNWQRLSPLHRRGFGSLLPSTSAATSAASAPSPAVAPSGASAAPPSPSSEASPSRPIDAHSGTSSTTTHPDLTSSFNPVSSVASGPSGLPSMHIVQQAKGTDSTAPPSSSTP